MEQDPRWDNLLEWRGEIKSTISNFTKVLDRIDAKLEKIEALCLAAPKDCQIHQAEVYAQLATSMTQLKEDMRLEVKNSMAEGSVQNDKDYASKAELNEVKHSNSTLPQKIAYIIVGLLAAYEILEGVGLL